MNLSNAFDNLDDVLWIYHSEEKRLAYVNSAIHFLCDTGKELDLNDISTIVELIHPADRAACGRAMEECLKRGFATIECRLNDFADERWMLLKGRLKREENETILIGSATDITLQKRAEKSFARFTERYDKILQSTLTGYFLVNLEGYIVNCNRAFAQMIGQNVSYVASTNVRKFFIPPEEGVDIIASVVKSGNNKGEASLQTREGLRIPIEYSASLIELHDRDLVVFFVEDNTQKEKVRDQLVRVMKHSEEVSRMKTSIMANVTHEIKSPIHRILGLTEIIDRESQNGELDDYLDKIRDNSQQVIQSLTALVEFSKLDSKIAQNHFKPINVWKSLAELSKELKQAAHQKNLKLLLPDIDPEVLILGDKFLLQETWRIIIGNSIKFTEEGQIRVSLSQEDNNVFIHIQDTGIGISEEFLPKIFSSFTQESNGFNRAYEGLGLGLSIARRYVQSHKGDIEVISENNKGTEVVVSIPMIS